jgi:hypothetical protein
MRHLTSKELLFIHDQLLERCDYLSTKWASLAKKRRTGELSETQVIEMDDYTKEITQIDTLLPKLKQILKQES